MNLRFKRFALYLFCFFSSLLYSVSSLAYVKDTTYYYTLVVFGDTHGHFVPDDLGQGGFAAIKTVVEQIRAEGLPVLVFHTGDFNRGTVVSDNLFALPDIYSLNDIGVDSVTVGNHEFDYNLATLKAQRDQLKMPLISSNVKYINKANNELEDFFEPYTIIERGGLKFLILGLTTPQTKYTANPLLTRDFEFLDPTITLLDTINQAYSTTPDIDVVLAVNHLGFYPLGNYGTSHYGDFTVAQNIPTGLVSAFISGNTHNQGCVNGFGQSITNFKPGQNCNIPFSNRMPIIASYRDGLYVSRADFSFSNGVSKLENYSLIPINVKSLDNGVYNQETPEIKPDLELAAKLNAWWNKEIDGLTIPIGKLDHVLRISRQFETVYGTFVPRTALDMLGGDLAILNSGSIREPLQRGEVTELMIRDSLPYAEPWVKVKMTGKQLQAYLRQIVLFDNGAKPNYANITFKVKRKGSELSSIMIGERPLEQDKVYTLLTSQFLALGGDHYPVIFDNGYPYTVTQVTDYQTVKNYFMKYKQVIVDSLKIEGPTWITD